ncbi:MAG: DotH/IcmK family type IV secretion protein, partial [Janthinobacterium lividum]
MRPFFSFPALVAGLVLPGLAVAQDAPAGAQDPSAGVQSSTAGVQQNPARDRELRDAIPLTPDMIRELGRRYQENQGAREDVATPFSAPASRPAINVSFAPGQQTSLIETAKGYPTAISFFDNTGAPWPIGWDTNSNAANPGGGTNCSSSSSIGGSPSVQAVGFYVCVPVKGSN